MEEQGQACYEFGPYRLDARRRMLTCDGIPVPLTARVFETLLILVQNHGREMSKQELMARIWPDSFVDESNLVQNIFLLRKALKEEPKEHRYIATVPGRGYRFVAEVWEHDGGRRKEGGRHLREPGEAENRATPVAVLPFKHLMPGEKDALLGVGLADAVIMRLSSLRHLSVRPTTSILRYTDPNQDPVAAGRELNVELVLDGIFQRDGDQLRVTSQLVKVEDGATLWAGKFDESFTNIFAVQDSIAEQVAQVLTARLSGQEQRQLRKSYTENAEAFLCYIRSRYFWDRRTIEGIKKGIAYAQQALAIDPAYAIAYVALADSYNVLAGFEGYPKVNFPKAKAAATRALEVDDTLAEAYASLAFINYHFDLDWRGAEEKFLRAIELKPHYPTARHWYGQYLACLGRFDESLAQLQKALELDPLSLPINTYLALALFFVGRLDESEEQFLRSIDMDPSFFLPYVFYGMVILQQGRRGEAISNMQKVLERRPGSTKARSALVGAYAGLGERSEALKALDDLLRLSAKQYVPASDIALGYLSLGEREIALDWLHKGLDEKDMWMVWLRVDPRFDALRPEPRFVEILKSLGLRP